MFKATRTIGIRILRMAGYLKICSVLLLFIFFGCNREKVTWQTDWSLPLVTDTLNLYNLVNDSTLAQTNQGFYKLELNRTLLNLGINDLVKLDAIDIQHQFNTSFASLFVPPGTSVVNSIETHSIQADGAQLSKVILSAGRVHFKIYNPLATSCEFVVRLPGVSRNGVEFAETLTLPAGSIMLPTSIESDIDLSGYTIDLKGIQGTSYNQIQSQLVVTTNPAGPTVQLTSQHQFKVEAKFDGIQLNFARGYMGSKMFSGIEEMDVNYFDVVQAGNLFLPQEMQLMFLVQNGFKVPLKVMLNQLKSTNKQGGNISLYGPVVGSPVYISQATGSVGQYTPSLTQLNYNSTNSNLIPFMENLGNRYQAAYEIQLNPFGNTSGGWDELDETSRLRVNLLASMPLKIGLGSLQLADTFDFYPVINLKKGSIERGQLVLSASNAFPIQGELELVFMDAQHNVVTSIAGDKPIVSATFGNWVPEKQVFVADSKILFNLTKDQVVDLERVHYVCVRSTFSTPNQLGQNEPCAIPNAAFLGIKLAVKFTYNTEL